jgi:DNA-binding response OmpR family regulator
LERWVASTIFVIDSSPAVRRMVEQISTPEGYEVVGFHDGPAALDAARKLSPRLIIADYHLENMTFSGFCKEVHKLDSLAETYIISLVGVGDRLDESHLPSLGVKAFLKKPFQTEHLLDLIKDLDHTATAQTNGSKKKRSWPPVSSATDSEAEGLDESRDEDQTGEIEAEVIPPPVRMDTAASQAPKQPVNEPEDAMKGLFAQLLQTMSEKAEQRVAEALPKMVSRDLAALVAKAVEAEMHEQFSATLTQERLVQTVEPLLARELPRVLSRELPEFEPILRHSIVEIAGPLVKEHVDHLVREQAEAIKTAVPEAVREHLKSIEDQVQEEVRKAAAEHTERYATEILRAAADQHAQQAAQDVVPAIAEEHIKSELKRLTKAA